MADTRHLVVGRLRKPHGMKGEVAVFPLTDDPDTAFAPGVELRRADLDGNLLGEPLLIERSRGYHREWLLKFTGLDVRDYTEDWRGQFLMAAADVLTPPDEDEVYIHELVGFSVRDADGGALGLVSDVLEMPAGLMIEVQGPKREFLLPYRREFIREVDREGRRLDVDVPDGLLD